MKQYEIEINKGNARNTVFCTAKSLEIALAAVRDAYAPQYTVSSNPIAERVAHYCYAEIDASMI